MYAAVQECGLSSGDAGSNPSRLEIKMLSMAKATGKHLKKSLSIKKAKKCYPCL